MSRDEYIKYKLERAESSLRAALLLFENEFFEDAVSKLYYAAFYAVGAMLNLKNLHPKSHEGTKSLLHKEFLITGIIDKELGKLYDNLLAKRFEADYEYYAIIDPTDIPMYIQGVRKIIDKAIHIHAKYNV